MTDNEVLARWQGWKHDKANLLIHCKAWIEPDGITRHDICPDYLNDDAAAMSLLDTLVEKTGHYRLSNSPYGHDVSIYYNKVLYRSTAATRREAVVATCLDVVRKEPTK